MPAAAPLPLPPLLQPRLDQQNDIAAEYLGKLLERHNGGHSENDIRTAWRDFVLRTGIIADENEITTETPPGAGVIRRVDLCVRNTYIEFKTSIIVNGQVDAAYIAQLDGYLLDADQAGWGIRNGILTDGKHYLKRQIGDSILPVAGNALQIFDRPGQGARLREYLNDIIDTDAQNIAPGSDTLTKYFGSGSDLFRQATALLLDAHRRHREHPTVAVKRKLWQELLQVALGQDSTGDPDDADWLFIRHTYLTTVTALILQAHFGIDVAQQAETNPEGLLNGATLNARAGLKGVIESDLFQWPGEIGQTEQVRAIARTVARFDWSRRAAELAAILYQNTITPEERRRMGEYYTPRWLAQALVDELLDDPLHTIAMDPSCGSGTFLECLAQRIIAAGRSAGLPAGAILEKLQGNIIGIDLHPVAVQLAKATWVLNCHEIITEARTMSTGSPPPPAPLAELAPPVYLGDSLQLRYDRNTLIGQGYITLLTSEQPDGAGAPVQFQIPMSLARDTDRFDRLMLDLAQAIDRGQDTERALARHGVAAGAAQDTMRHTIAQMQQLHAADRNHVWAYYLRNMVRPAVIAEQKVDAIVGNPPWLTYSRSADIVREELLGLSKDAYGIWAGGKYAGNQDVATLFFCRVTDLYLKDGGKIGMVLPHSVLRAGQHSKWRAGFWQTPKGRNRTGISIDFRIKAPWDLDYLEPNNFFPISSAVAFAQLVGKSSNLQQGKQTARPLAPALVEIWRGPTDTPAVTRHPEPLHDDDGEFHSPYADLAAVGPTIRDRRLFWVNTAPSEGFLAMPNTWVTTPRIGSQDKKKYDVSVLAGAIVHDDNLFDVYAGENIAPYVALQPVTAVLPVSKATMTMPLDHSRCSRNARTGRVKHDACQVDVQDLDARMQERWPMMETLWDANKGRNDAKSLLQRLNYNRSLTSQLEYLRDPGDRPVRIAYTSSGRPTAALITDDKAILDYLTYQVTCRNLDEAYYLLAIINSDALADAAKPFCTTNWARKIRNLDKHLWKLPIPAYDASAVGHRELSALGVRASAEARAALSDLERPDGTAARARLRHRWQPASATAQSIEAAVARLLGGGQAAAFVETAVAHRLQS